MSLANTISGVAPKCCLKAELGPPRSECGVGALMPWADKLWAIGYVSSLKDSGVGTGLYEIDEDLNMTKRPESVTGVYANRFVHNPSNQMIIGPYIIDNKRNVRYIKGLDARLTANMEHLTDHENMVYFLGMEGELFEVNVHTLEVKQIADIVKELNLPFVHFKAGYTVDGKVIVADNSYDNEEFKGKRSAGVLAQWDGKTWEIIERSPFVEIAGRGKAVPVFAMGWDKRSAILKVLMPGKKEWDTYRLPKASHTFDHMWATEWPRIRETEHERFLMDCHGMFYELPQWHYGDKIWGIRPISTHLWVMGDFCTYRGMLVMGADNASPANSQNIVQGEPQSGLWFGKTDDLWQYGKPKGWGGPWWDTDIKANEFSDPFLMTGFDKKCLHLSTEDKKEVNFNIEIDFQGDGNWKTFKSIQVGKSGYAHYEFPDGFSAHWVRLSADSDCIATAQFNYS